MESKSVQCFDKNYKLALTLLFPPPMCSKTVQICIAAAASTRASIVAEDS